MFSLRAAAPALSRGYATAAAKKITPPIQFQSLPGKYATAAFTGALSKSTDALSQVEADLTSLSKLIESKDQATVFLANPTLSANERASEIKALVGKLSKPSEVTTNLLGVLSANGRLTSTTEVIRNFLELTKAYRGELEVTVTSAEPLDKQLQSRLESALKGSEAVKGKTMKIVNKVNPALLGGLIVDFGDKTVDLSASSKVNKLNGLLVASV